RSPSLPVTGWRAASTIRYEVTSQPARATPTSKSRMIRGRATAIIVELSGARIVLSATAAMIACSLREAAGSGVTSRVPLGPGRRNRRGREGLLHQPQHPRTLPLEDGLQA